MNHSIDAVFVHKCSEKVCKILRKTRLQISKFSLPKIDSTSRVIPGNLLILGNINIIIIPDQYYYFTKFIYFFYYFR